MIILKIIGIIAIVIAVLFILSLFKTAYGIL